MEQEFLVGVPDVSCHLFHRGRWMTVLWMDGRTCFEFCFVYGDGSLVGVPDFLFVFLRTTLQRVGMEYCVFF